MRIRGKKNVDEPRSLPDSNLERHEKYAGLFGEKEEEDVSSGLGEGNL